MPVPFRDDDDVQELGQAAFLTFADLNGTATLAGALFLVNGRGEPVEFAYNRIELPQSVLWRQADLRRYAARKLAVSLLGVCAGTPALLLCLAEEVKSELFCQDIRVAVPVARIGQLSHTVSYAALETEEAIDHPQPVHLYWFPRPPAAGSTERRLIERLVSHGLLLEPFERATRGIQEVYAAGHGATP